MWSGKKNGGNEGGTALENERERLVWDFEVHLRKTTMVRRSDMTLENKAKRKMCICDMVWPQQWNIEAKRLEKLTKYIQLAYELRERHPEYEIIVVPVVIGALGGGIRKIMVDMGKGFKVNIFWNEQSAKCRKQFWWTVRLPREIFSRD